MNDQFKLLEVALAQEIKELDELVTERKNAVVASNYDSPGVGLLLIDTARVCTLHDIHKIVLEINKLEGE